MIVRVKGANDYLGLWTYEKFKEFHKASLISSETKGNLIISLTYNLSIPINDMYTKSLGIEYEILNDNNYKTEE